MKYIFLVLCLINYAFAADIKNESELSFIQTGGNTSVQTYNVKTQTSIDTKDYIYTLAGQYFLSLYESEDDNGDTVDVESARNWQFSVKMEKNLGKRLNIFTQLQVEGDKFSGYDQRDNYDFGGKYKFIDKEKEKFFSELGLRYTVEHKTEAASDEDSIIYSNKGRLHIEYEKQSTKSLSYKFWIEYLPNFTDGNDYMVNFEPSLSVLLSNIFSLKLAYNGNYDNDPAIEGNDNLDFKYTTSLIAKY